VISQADADATLRRYGLAKWITRFRREALFAEPIALTLIIRPGHWDPYGKPKGKPRFKIDWDAEWRVEGPYGRQDPPHGVTTFRWSANADVLTLRWLRTTEPAYRGIPDEVFRRALYTTRSFSRVP
jgi:hypothetical protein